MKKIAVSRNHYTYRITKFNPEKRNEQGAYLDSSEWTAISDIGKPEYNNPTYEEYEKVENAYISAVRIILEEKAIISLEISSLELHGAEDYFDSYKSNGRLQNLILNFENDIAGLRNKMQLAGDQLDKTMRLILREVIWLILSNREVKVEFGYDYYMYVECSIISVAIIKQIEESGLFVERLC